MSLGIAVSAVTDAANCPQTNALLIRMPKHIGSDLVNSPSSPNLSFMRSSEYLVNQEGSSSIGNAAFGGFDGLPQFLYGFL